ncbi:hypothetical protein VAWG002_18000 [Aeromonas veronii]|nr:hypothetical protein VAWG002_18000 [Aeromonas veronii]
MLAVVDRQGIVLGQHIHLDGDQLTLPHAGDRQSRLPFAIVQITLLMVMVMAVIMGMRVGMAVVMRVGMIMMMVAGVIMVVLMRLIMALVAYGSPYPVVVVMDISLMVIVVVNDQGAR